MLRQSELFLGSARGSWRTNWSSRSVRTVQNGVCNHQHLAWLSTPPTGHHTSALQRFVLRITKTAKDGQSLSEVSPGLMEKANSRFRIGLMGFMMLFCVIGSAYSIHQGKKAREFKSSVHQQNRDRHAKFKS